MLDEISPLNTVSVGVDESGVVDVVGAGVIAVVSPPPLLPHPVIAIVVAEANAISVFLEYVIFFPCFKMFSMIMVKSNKLGTDWEQIGNIFFVINSVQFSF